MKRIDLVLLLSVVLGSNSIYAQQYAVSSGTFGLTQLTNPTGVLLSDDEVSEGIPLGFDFNFFGIEYDEVHISSNGFITFLSDQDDGCCSGQDLPDPTDPNGLIAGYWEDLNPESGGSIGYELTGETPNRVFIVEFSDVPHFGASDAITFQLKLSEQSNSIEIHCSSCNSDAGSHTQGIEDHSGNSAFFIDGRTIADFSLTEDAVVFTGPFFISAEGTSVTISWGNAVQGESGYDVDRSFDGVNYSLIDQLAAGTSEFTDTGLTLETTVFYRLTANFDLGSPVVVDLSTTTAPVAPTDLMADAQSPVEVELTWTDNSNAEDEYVIERSLSPLDGFEEIKLISANSTSFNDAFASPSTTYYYRVGTKNQFGISYSSIEEVTTFDAQRFFVNPEATLGGNDGSSWADAFLDLTDAFVAAGDGDEIWVANSDAGYLPGSGDPSPTSTFFVFGTGMRIYGGFTGNENDLTERPVDGRTILEGKFGSSGDPLLDNINTIMTIGATDGSTLIDGFSFRDAYSETAGGALVISSSLEVVNCAFTSNQSGTGGAIFLSTEGITDHDLNVSNSVFSNNQALSDGISDGGAIFFASFGDITVDNTEFSNNSAGDSGGAIFSYGNNIYIDLSTFTGNTADNGGAVYLDGQEVGALELNISNSTFSGNIASNGGAIYFDLYSETGDVTVTNGGFSSNVATSYGGGIYFSSHGSLVLTEMNFSLNQAEYGSAIYQYNGRTEITNSLFDQNQASSNGSIYTESGGGSTADLIIISSSFRENTASSGGGAIYYNGYGLFALTLVDHANNSSDFGGAIYFGSGFGNFDNSTFIENTASSSGGAIYASAYESSSELNIINSTFESNEAQDADSNGSGDGGAIYANGFGVDIEDSELLNNMAAGHGGAIYHQNDNLYITNSYLAGNTAGKAGGGLNSGSYEVDITNSTIADNHAGKRGGGLAVRGPEIGEDTNLQIVNSTFAKNTSESSGGAIHWGPASSYAIANLAHVTISGNTATATGGGISTFSGSSEVRFNNTIIAGNTGSSNRPDISVVQGNQGGDDVLDQGVFVSEGNNLIGNLGGFIFDTNTTGDQYGDPMSTTTANEGAVESAVTIDPKLGDLEVDPDHPDYTIPTLPLLPTSPALDKGSVSTIDEDEILADQRGVAHVGTPDIGAYEFDSNFPPVLDNSQEVSLTAINEDDVGNQGDLLQNVGPEQDIITDPDGPELGIAIIGVDETAGNWQYSLDNGTNWTNMGSPSLTAALLLPIDEQVRIRLQPALNFNGNVGEALTFRAWDQATGAAGSTVNINQLSDFTVSEETGTVSITVNPVNDAPAIIAQDLILTALSEDDINNEGNLLKNLGGDDGLMTDVDGPGKGIAIIGVKTSNGSWQYSLDNGTTWTAVGSPKDFAALLLPIDEMARLRFVPASDFSGSVVDAVTFKAWDQSSGTVGGTLDVRNFNASSAFSEGNETMTISVIAINDAPRVVNPIDDLEIPLGRFNFTFGEDVFLDAEDGIELAYSASGLPSWLTFNAATRTFTGILRSGTSGTSSIIVTATDSENATGSDGFDIVINPLLAVGDELGNSIKIYPVPNYGIMELDISNSYIGVVTVRILDTSGKSVFGTAIEKNRSELRTNINLVHLNQGFYLVEFSMGSGRVLKRFVKN